MTKKNIALTQGAANQILQAVLLRYSPNSNIRLRVQNSKDRARKSDLVSAVDPLVKDLIFLIESGSGKEE